MGFLAEVEREKEKMTSKGHAKQNDKKRINKKVIKAHHKKQIEKEESDVKEHKHEISIISSKLQVKRPRGSAKKLGKKIDMDAMNAEIQNEMEKTKKNSGEVVEEHETHVPQDRIHTGIPGLDGVMEGGFRRNTVNLVGGGAGSGKSILCMQFLVEGIRQHGENGVYISFEENEEDILRDFKRFGWNLPKLIKEKKLVILYYSPEQVEKVLKIGGGTVRDVIESINAKRLVLDSLTAFTLLHETELAKRKEVLKLIESMQKWGITALMTSEQEPDPEKHHSTVVEFEVEGVILLYNIRKGDIRERSLEIFKMRGTVHSNKIFPMKIYDKGIMIYPEETVF